MTGTYGHGTENDFVLIFDPENELEISAAQVVRICNRETGIGSDGLIRIGKQDDKWFMDYRNSDGSIAEMCGNGIRVMARYLVEKSHQGAGIFPINTRNGMKYLAVPEKGDITVNMGQISEVFGEISATTNGHTWVGYNIDMGNPHAVVFVENLDEVGDLRVPPTVEPLEEYPDGVNVEFVEFLSNGELKIRVHERGVGETKSCGTGTCAVALAASLLKGKQLPAKWIINPPGGKLSVEIDAHSNAILTGPAVLISEHDLSKYL
jgi:diaminopimelate epimerase